MLFITKNVLLVLKLLFGNKENYIIKTIDVITNIVKEEREDLDKKGDKMILKLKI